MHGVEDDLAPHGSLRKAARRAPRSRRVVQRGGDAARWPEETVTAAELLDWYRDEGPLLGSDGLAVVESLKQHDVTAGEELEIVA